MQKLLNREIKMILVRYHKTLNDDAITDRSRDGKLSKFTKQLKPFKNDDIKDTALILSRSSKRTMLFKVWCELIVLTGEP
jgi:hypothetical protein